MIRRASPRSFDPHGGGRSRGFTLVELMITLVVLGLVMVVLSTVIYTAARSKVATSNRVESSQATRIAVDLIARDLRNAGYGADREYNPLPQPPIAYVDSLQVLINANIHGDGDAVWDTTAYNPAGNPKPFPLNGTAWQPPIKYRTRAEVVRWTLDLNNDGLVDANDVAHADGIDARRTTNPNDYMLVRQVYGDSTGAAAGNNGGSSERVALIRRPSTGDIPPLFTVYLFGSATPWNWANGPIPPSRLRDIERIEVRAVGTSPRPDWRGQYATTHYQTEVKTTRNVPNFGSVEYAIDGRVFDDLNGNLVQNAGEPGIFGAQMILTGGLVTTTDSTGYFQFRMPAGTYTLRHNPPVGYTTLTSPDSFVVTVGPPQTRNFADKKLPGGRVKVFTFDDANANGYFDAGEQPRRAVQTKMSPTNEIGYTNNNGLLDMYAPVGAFDVTVTAPDSFVVTTTNPYSGTMVDGGTDSVAFGLARSGTGKVQGKVFVDNNRNGVLDAGESGIANVWVGVTPDGGVTVAGYQYTNASGDFDITVAANNPPGTDPYYATVIVPPGFYATGSTAKGPLLVGPSQVITGQNFGMASFQIITLNASRVLSLDSADLIEHDWTGAASLWDTKGRQDADIVLGADAGGTDNISVWFNNYNGSPLFDPNPTYTRNAPQSVLSLKLERLDNNSPWERPDLVTGTKNATAGNLFVWFNQNSSGNLGYFGTTYNSGQNYRTLDNGDVTVVLTQDVGGDARADIIAGTKSPTANQGSIEVWLNSGGATPTFVRDEVYPPAGSLPGGNLGEVTAMVLVDYDKDGDQDLIVGTKRGTDGYIHLLKNNGRVSGGRFVERRTQKLDNRPVTALAATDVNGDTWPDVIVGTQTGVAAGQLELWGNTNSGDDWALLKVVPAPGLVLALRTADLGGLPREDIIMGWRQDGTSYVGGTRVYFTDLGTIPPFGSDPSAGALGYMVPAITVNNFNYGVQPTTPAPPFLSDFGVGVKTGPTTGALVLFIR